MSSSADVVIAGAGPAGAVLAALVARPGRRVVLLHRPGADSGVLEETVVGTARPLFERLGLLPIVEELGFHGSARHGTIWGSDELVWRTLAPIEGSGQGERGFKIDRAHFDERLRVLAAARGVQIRHDATARAPWNAPAVRFDGREGELDARVVVAATGRNTPEALVDARVVDELPDTLALTARIEDAGTFADATVIEAVPEGWWWWIPLHGGGASATLFVDREELGERGRDVLWSSGRAHALGPAAGAPPAPERGTLASTRLRETRADVLLVGDAASSVDPLSSQGLEKALASAEHAAPCVNALLEGKLDRELVLAHRRGWERRLFQAHARSTLAFYATEQRFTHHPFWSKRHVLAGRTMDRPVVTLPDHLALSLELERAPVLQRKGDALETVPGWRLRGTDCALASLGGLDIEALLDCCRDGSTLEQAIACAAHDPRLVAHSPRVVMDGLRALFNERFLTARGGAAATENE